MFNKLFEELYFELEDLDYLFKEVLKDPTDDTAIDDFLYRLKTARGIAEEIEMKVEDAFTDIVSQL